MSFKQFFYCILLSMILFKMIDARGTEGSCPNVCACKWKGGKQTVECIDRSLIQIPTDIDPSSQVLDMSGNNLQILKREAFVIAGLHNLQKVYLRNCRLGQIDDDAFKGLTNLVELDLSQNLLTSIPSATLSQIKSLRDLNFASNPIQKIESNSFSTVTSLNKLDLSHCELQMIAPQAFKGLNLLHTLKLNGNKLSELRPQTVETLRKLHGVELHDNPWMCDCHLRAAKIWLTDNNIPYTVAPLCSGGPERVMDRTFADLHVDDFACKPEMLPVSRFIEATTGENASIVCRAGAIPSATVNWYWNGRLLMNNSAFSSYQKVYIYEDGQFEKRSRLVLTNSQESDSSDFYCVAENRAGNDEANFTLHVTMRQAGMATLGSGQIAGLSAALVIIILFILLIILFLLIRLRRIPFSESKTPGQMEIITTVSPQINTNGKTCTTPTINDVNSIDRKTPSDLKFANPVQKPPRLTDLPYSTTHYDGNGSILSSGQLFLSPSASAGNNPDLINDTKRLGSGEFVGLTIDSIPPATTILSAGLDDFVDRPGSGEYSRAGCDSLYPSGLWEQSTGGQKSIESNKDDFLKRATSTTLSGYSYTDKTPIIMDNSHTMNLDDETSSAEFISRTFPRTNVGGRSSCGYPSDYGLPIVPGAEQIKSRDMMPQLGMPANAKTIRVWQRGGVPVLPPVTALKRALSNSRNSPDEGYQEGCGTDV